MNLAGLRQIKAFFPLAGKMKLLLSLSFAILLLTSQCFQTPVYGRVLMATSNASSTTRKLFQLGAIAGVIGDAGKGGEAAKGGEAGKELAKEGGKEGAEEGVDQAMKSASGLPAISSWSMYLLTLGALVWINL